MANALPFLSILVFLPMLAVLVIVLVKMCDAINAVANGPKTIP